MRDNLTVKIAELQANIAASDAGHRALLTAQLHRAMSEKEAQLERGRTRATRDEDEAFEEMWDNLPV